MARQHKADKNYDILRNYNSIPIGSSVVDQWNNWGCGPMQQSFIKVLIATIIICTELRRQSPDN